MIKQCSKCGVTKAFEEFPKGGGTHGLHSYCKSCFAAYAKERRAQNPVKQNYTYEERCNFNLRSMYGITLEEYETMLDNQGGACAACPKLASESTKVFQVDHDHSCCPGQKSCGACVRGLLCHGCNSALGMVNDDPDRLEALAAYVRRLH